MTRNGVILALSMALVLALAALWATSSTAPPENPRLIPIDPARVVELIIESPAGAPARLRRFGEEWTLVLAEGCQWRIEPAQIRAALRILSTLEPLGDAQRDLAPGEFGRVSLIGEDGARVAARIGTRSLAGRVIACAEAGGVPSRACWVDAQIAEALFATGPSAWRSRLVAADAVVEAARVRFQSGDRSLELARVQGRWVLIEPALGPADGPAVDAFLKRLASIRVVEFDAPQPGEESSAILLIESKPTGEGAARRTERFEIHVGGPADAEAKSLRARLTRGAVVGGAASELWSGSAALAREELEGIVMDPLAYVDRVALAAAPEDIAGIRVMGRSGSREFRLDLGVWKLGGSPASSETLAGIAGVIELLAKARAEGVVPATNLSPAPLATVELSWLGGGEPASVEVGTIEIEGGRTVLAARLRGQDFIRVYAEGVGVQAAGLLAREP